MDAREFLDAVARTIPTQGPPTRLATIDLAYAAGRPKVTFDGESVLSPRTYPYLASYVPAAGHRVLMLRSGSTWVVVGRVI